DYVVVVVLPSGAQKESTAAVYRAFDERDGARGFAERRAHLHAELERVRTAADLASLPPNDLARSPLADTLRELGAFRADVSGAGPARYGLFLEQPAAEAAARALRRIGRVFVTRPCWYG